MEELKREGLLLPYDKADVSAYPQGLDDPDKTWFAHETDHDRHRLQQPRLDQADLMDGPDPRPRPRTSSCCRARSPRGRRSIHTATLSSNLPEGWRFYEALKANGAQVAGGNGDVLRQVAGGEKLFGMIVDFMPIREKAKGAPVEFVFPARGRLGGQRAGRDPEIDPEPRSRQGLRRFPAVARRPGTRARSMGYVPALADDRRAGGLSRPGRDQADALRSGGGARERSRGPEALRRYLRPIRLAVTRRSPRQDGSRA